MTLAGISLVLTPNINTHNIDIELNLIHYFIRLFITNIKELDSLAMS